MKNKRTNNKSQKLLKKEYKKLIKLWQLEHYNDLIVII